MIAESSTTGILRAEIAMSDRVDVCAALELTEQSVFLISDDLPAIDSRMAVRLSFPNIFAPIELRGSVSQVHMSGPGRPSGYVCKFDIPDAVSETRLLSLLNNISLATARATSRGAAPRVRVLLVEDGRLIRDMFAYAVTKYFERREGRVELAQAEDADAGWQHLQRGEFDVAIVDHFLPEPSGAALIAKLRAEARLAKTTAIGVSVGGDRARRAMLDAGADFFLAKPIVLRDLFRTLEFLMARSTSDAGAA